MELYIHLPFCVRKCAYCAFDSFAGCSSGEIRAYLAALLREARFRRKEVTEPFETVYIGGGTPSLVPADMMASFLSELNDILDLSAVSEFSTEANPGAVTDEWLDAVRQAGGNRISFGMQAAQPALLKTLGRIHTSDETAKAVQLARKHGFVNISMDLIFGIPDQTMTDWCETLETALGLDPVHISAYGLIPEDGTPLKQKLDKGELILPDPELERNMYDLAITRFRNAGLKQYEISNFARECCECRHNIGYWDQIPYLGLGLSAASMRRIIPASADCFSIRRTNPNTFASYYRMLENPSDDGASIESVSPEAARFETVMLSLRMTKGMDRARFCELHGNPPEFFYGNILSGLEKKNLLILENTAWRLTRRGMDIQNAILLEFMP